MSVVLIDTNLLVLLVVGGVSREYIARHKRLAEFIADDYDVLVQVLSNFTSLLVTPNTLTETSNLAAHISEPAKGQVLAALHELITRATESYVPSQEASSRKEFIRLGLTDASILQLCINQVTLLTTDLDLWMAAMRGGVTAINFNHFRDQYLGPSR